MLDTFYSLSSLFSHQIYLLTFYHIFHRKKRANQALRNLVRSLLCFIFEQKMA